MKEFKGTKGPWEKGQNGFGDDLMIYCDDTAGSAVADCRLPQSIKITNEEKLANAHLIAAAPELLQVLIECKDELYRFLPTTTFTLKKVEAAINKALGE